MFEVWRLVLLSGSRGSLRLQKPVAMNPVRAAAEKSLNGVTAI
jgi:hypothetical protein